MKKYFLHNGTIQEGPFDNEDLRAKNISNDTPIWHEGLSEWTTAGKIEELKDVLKLSPPPFKTSTPPPIQKPSSTQNNSIQIPIKKKSNWIIRVIIAAVILGVVLYRFNKNNSNPTVNPYETNGETYQEKVMTVEEIERSQPTNFLTADGNYNENFRRDKIKVHGVITNKATVATYKDAIIRITYYSKTKTELTQEDYTIYNFFPPNSTKNFELKIKNYSNVGSIGWEVIDAVPQ